jgi:hypothetical protein
MATSGTMIRATNMMQPCTKSVRLTARKAAEERVGDDHARGEQQAEP